MITYLKKFGWSLGAGPASPWAQSTNIIDVFPLYNYTPHQCIDSITSINFEGYDWILLCSDDIGDEGDFKTSTFRYRSVYKFFEKLESK